MLKSKKLSALLVVLLLVVLTGCNIFKDGDMNSAPVINSLNPSVSAVKPGGQVTLTADVSDPNGDSLNYQWVTDNGSIEGVGEQITWTAPSTSGNYIIKLIVSDGELKTSSDLSVTVNNEVPTINSISVTPNTVNINETSTIAVDATDSNGSVLSYSYNATEGSISGTGSSVTYTAPSSTGTYTIEVTVSDGSNNVSTSKEITVTPVVWQQVYTGGEGQRVFETSDGGYLAVDDRFQVVKVDSQGNKLWANDYISDTAVILTDMKDTSDNGAILVGNNNTTGEIHLVKIDSSGSQLWSKVYTENVFLNAVIETASGNYIAIGYSGDYSTDNQVIAIKFDNQGNKLWSKTYGSTTNNEQGLSVLATTNGYLLAGYKNNGTDNDIYVLKIDSLGVKQWEKSYSTTGNQEVNSILEVNGDYILAGYTDQTGYDNAYLIKIDSLGVKQWEKTYGGTDDDLFHDIEKTLDGNYIAVGTTRSFASNRVDYYLVKLDSQFSELWHKAYGVETYDRSYDVDVVSDGGYILGGYDAIDRSIYLVKTDSQGNTGSLPQ